MTALRWGSISFALAVAVADLAARPPREPAPPPAPDLLAQLDRLEARLAALAAAGPDPALCAQVGCLAGVESVELRRGVVSCRCRKLPSLGVHRLPPRSP